MRLGDIIEIIKSEEYAFLQDDPHLGDNIVLLTLGGSHAYGTSNEGSDIDVRGCVLNCREDLLTNGVFMGGRFEQFTDEVTDTTIYSFNKLITLLLNTNPNTIEMLGNKPEHYLHLAPIGRELLANTRLFLSKRAIHSFGGYANQQLRRLNNKAVRTVEQEAQERHILKTIEHASYDFAHKYFDMPEDAIRLYTDKAIQDGMDTEIFMDVTLRHYPLRDYVSMWSEMQSIVKAYGKIGKRNQNASTHGKLGKHMMHLIRLYIMCLDILEKEEVITYRDKEHDLLMEIRNGAYLDGSNQPIPEFFLLVDEYERRLDYAREHTRLPDAPDYKKVSDFVVSVNERVVRHEL